MRNADLLLACRAAFISGVKYKLVFVTTSAIAGETGSGTMGALSIKHSRDSEKTVSTETLYRKCGKDFARVARRGYAYGY